MQYNNISTPFSSWITRNFIYISIFKKLTQSCFNCCTAVSVPSPASIYKQHEYDSLPFTIHLLHNLKTSSEILLTWDVTRTPWEHNLLLQMFNYNYETPITFANKSVRSVSILVTSSLQLFNFASNSLIWPSLMYMKSAIHDSFQTTSWNSDTTFGKTENMSFRKYVCFIARKKLHGN